MSNDGYILGLLSELEPKVPKLEEELRQGLLRAQAVDAELSLLLAEQGTCNANLSQEVARARDRAQHIAEANAQIARLHQEIAGLQKRMDDLKSEMDRVGPGEIQRTLRRERAKLQVSSDDKKAQTEGLRAQVETMRGELQAAEASKGEGKAKLAHLVAQIDALQASLPAPHLYVRLFEAKIARAHCRYRLERNRDVWCAAVTDAVELMLTFHRDLRLGKYRLDKNSDLVGGRAIATAEALFGAVAIDAQQAARALFESATDPSLFFHQIFSVFRVWCLGLYLDGNRQALMELLALHAYDDGLRGGYVDGFSGLMEHDQTRLATGLSGIVKHEAQMWQAAHCERGVGVINLGALALSKLALAQGIAVRLPGGTVPDTLL